MIIGKLKKLKSTTILIIGLILLVISFAPFLFVTELPKGNKGQLQGLFSMLWTVFTMIPAILLTSAGLIIFIHKLIQSRFKINQVLSLGVSTVTIGSYFANEKIDDNLFEIIPIVEHFEKKK